MTFFQCNDAARHTFEISLPVVGALRGPVVLKACSTCGEVRLSDAALGAWQNSGGAEQVGVKDQKPTKYELHFVDRPGGSLDNHFHRTMFGTLDCKHYDRELTVHDTRECHNYIKGKFASGEWK